jgi:hypothetical protein
MFDTSYLTDLPRTFIHIHGLRYDHWTWMCWRGIQYRTEMEYDVLSVVRTIVKYMRPEDWVEYVSDRAFQDYAVETLKRPYSFFSLTCNATPC